MSQIASSKPARASRSKKQKTEIAPEVSAHDASNALIAETIANNPDLAALVIVTEAPQKIETDETDVTDAIETKFIMDDFGDEHEVMAQPVTDLESLNAELTQIADTATEAPSYFEEQLLSGEPIHEAIIDVLTEEQMAQLNADLAVAEVNVKAESASSVTDMGIVDHGSQFGSWSVSSASIEAQAEASKIVTAYDELLATIPDDKIETMLNAIADQMDTRAAFEIDKNPENLNIQRTLKKAREQMVTKRAAKVLIAANIDPAFINRVLHDGSRYNVYALGKLADVVYALTDGVLKNAINRACMKSLFACKNAGFTFTMDVAKAAASDKINTIDVNVRKVLVRHTVSASTAPTQSSSTMQALKTLGVVSTSGSTRNPTYTLTAHPVVEKLEVMMKAA